MTGGTRSYEMARRMVLAGHEVNVVSARSTTLGESRGIVKYVVDGVTVHTLPVNYNQKMPVPRRFLAFLVFSIRASIYASSLDADVVFASSTPLTIAIPGVFAARRQRAPFVFEVRDLWPDVPIALGALRFFGAQWLARRLEKWAYDNARFVVALSPGMRDGVVSKGCPEERVRCIPNAADLELFAVPAEVGGSARSRRAWLQDRPLVLYAGTVGRVNGVEYLVKLASAMERIAPDVRFLVVGSGSKWRDVSDLARQQGVLGQNFFMESEVSKNEIPELFSAATVSTSVVIPVEALWHNSANKFFDSLAASRPIVINYEGWQADIIRSEECGLVVSHSDIPSAANQLKAFLLDKSALSLAGQAARDLASRRFSRELLTQELIMLLEEAVDSPARR